MKPLAIYSKAEEIVRKYETRDPFEALDAMHIETVFSYRYPKDGLKGFCISMVHSQNVVINGHMYEIEQRVVGSHELAHIVLHQDELRRGVHSDYNIYRSTGRIEREANLWGADFMLDDEEVLDLVHSQGASFFSVARSLLVPSEFFAFKLYSMIERGYPMKMPVELNSTFLAVKRR